MLPRYHSTGACMRPRRACSAGTPSLAAQALVQHCAPRAHEASAAAVASCRLQAWRARARAGQQRARNQGAAHKHCSAEEYGLHGTLTSGCDVLSSPGKNGAKMAGVLALLAAPLRLLLSTHGA